MSYIDTNFPDFPRYIVASLIMAADPEVPQADNPLYVRRAAKLAVAAADILLEELEAQKPAESLD